MSKEITKAYILQQIQDKFALRELDPETFRFSEMVVPIYDIEEHLKSCNSFSADISITSGPAGFVFFTVPPTERWVLHAYNIVFMAAGAYTVTGLYIRRAGASEFLYLDMTLGQTVSYSVVLPQPIVLEPQDQLWVYIDSYTSTADLRTLIRASKETIR